jgi:hypothetical protein
MFGAVAMPAAAGTVYQWRTEEGSFAFADSLKKVPARYRDEMTTRRMESLSGYERLTPVDNAATARYDRQLAARLDALRSRSARWATPQAISSVMAANPILLSMGVNSPAIQVTPEAGNGPVVMEKVPSRDGPVTRHAWVVKQGEKVIAVRLPRSRVYNTSDFPTEQSTW